MGDEEGEDTMPLRPEDVISVDDWGLDVSKSEEEVLLEDLRRP